MSEVPVSLSDYEQRVIRLLAKHYHENSERFRIDNLPKDNLTRDDIRKIILRLERYGLIEPCTNESIRILPRLLDAAHQLDNPPTPDDRDYPKEVERWFRSKWWSVPLWMLLVVLPALVGYITMIRMLLEWLSIIEK